MSTNNVTQFPPATYSSTFCQNEESMYVLHLIIAFTIIYQTSPQEYCDEYKSNKPKIFQTILEYKSTDISLKSENWIEFEEKMFHLEPKIFVSNQSNSIKKLGLQRKDILIIDSGAFDELNCLVVLLLDQNKISDLSSDIFRGLEHLEELVLSYNQLKGIAESTFSKLRHLIKLDLSNNAIKYLTTKSFEGLENLWELNLNHNKILDFPSDLFKSTPKLTWLFVSSNKLSVPTTPTLRDLTSLANLDLSGNGISYIYEEMFKSLAKLTSLDLSNNHLRTLNIRNLKMNLPELEKINLYENSWECSILENMLTDLKSYRILVVVNGTAKMDVRATDVGCYDNGKVTTTAAPESTTDPFPKDINFFDDSEILAAIENLKSYVVTILVIVLFYILTNILIKFSLCPPFANRRTTFLQFQQNDDSLPLLRR